MHLGVVKVGLLRFAKPEVISQHIISAKTKNSTLDNFSSNFDKISMLALDLNITIENWILHKISMLALLVIFDIPILSMKNGICLFLRLVKNGN